MLQSLSGNPERWTRLTELLIPSSILSTTGFCGFPCSPFTCTDKSGCKDSHSAKRVTYNSDSWLCQYLVAASNYTPQGSRCRGLWVHWTWISPCWPEECWMVQQYQHKEESQQGAMSPSSNILTTHMWVGVGWLGTLGCHSKLMAAYCSTALCLIVCWGNM